MTVKVLPPVNTLADFIGLLHDREIRLVKLTDYGYVEPQEKGRGSIVMQPMVRVIATALDASAREIVSWEIEGEARQMVKLGTGTGRGSNPDLDSVVEKRKARDVLRQLGYEVDEGEWTPKAAEQVIAALAHTTKRPVGARKPA